jgi:hypothetical protein
MSTHRTLSLLVATAGLGLAAPLHAQGRCALTSAELEAAVTTRPAGTREAVRDFLAIPQVQKVADRMGVSTAELSAGVATLDQSSLDRIAQLGVVADRPLAGGDNTIVISTTAIIIGLLILILLVK